MVWGNQTSFVKDGLFVMPQPKAQGVARASFLVATAPPLRSVVSCSDDSCRRNALQPAALRGP